jgi:hypothetical protein
MVAPPTHHRSAVTMIDRLCAEALARGAKLLYQRLTQWLEGRLLYQTRRFAVAKS